jgi:hypothetical protein
MLLLCYGPRSITIPAPYFDSHGGSHAGQRGRPLRLDEQKYRSIMNTVVGMNIPRDVIQKRSCSARVILNGYY